MTFIQARDLISAEVLKDQSVFLVSAAGSQTVLEPKRSP